jgi:hypothetical protein
MNLEASPAPPNLVDEQAEDLNPFHIAAQQFDRAALHLPELKHGLIDFLKRPARTVIVEFPVDLADGSVQTFTIRCVARAKAASVSTRRSRSMRCVPWRPG